MNNTDWDEYENIKDNIIYLDWNIISYLNKGLDLHNEMDRKIYCLSYVMNNILNRRKCVFPYSNGHFLDIKMGSDELIDNCLQQLFDISGGWEIYENPRNQDELMIIKTNIRERYREYSDYLDKQNEYANKNKVNLEKLIQPYRDNANVIIANNNLKNTDVDMVNKVFDALMYGEDQSPQIEVMKLNKFLRNIKGEKKIKYPNS
ncbi:MAG: hypothetical protein PQJ61_09580 [Spirochaetales bacterium]|uniref:Uncharacterized protein n=1 Tax=Candidatus Thalassospirochaeta sargassi TaxID=3119039 RepID=A0AAJ1IIS8_9SPIO|nr:hypothetical protein [Spirochaetales bacterium]